ncbi:MAG: hypothetical protein RL490_818 [Pseudomonadota bacterium]|jgi:endonuclease G
MASIATDPDFDNALEQLAGAAAARWDARTRIRDDRTKALAKGRLFEADSPERLALRVNNLIADVRGVARDRRPPASARLRALIETSAPITAAELDESLLQEVVVGARDFLSVEFLERGLVAAHAVGRVVLRSGGGQVARGTGFLVAEGVMLTNHHVLPSADIAAACAIEMDYEQNRFGSPRQPTLFALEPDRLYLAAEALDYALVAVAPLGSRNRSIAGYGWLPLNARLGKIAITPDDFLNIIQHPLGREKEIVLRENRVLDLKTGTDSGGDAIGSFIHYQGDTEKGSSGSPVFNDQWEVIALHHSGVPRRSAAGEWLNREGNVWDRASQPLAEIDWIANEGVRVSGLVAALSAASVDPAAAPLLQKVLAGVAPEPGPLGTPDPREALPATTPTATPTATPSPAAEAHDIAITAGGSTTITVPLRLTIAISADAPTRAPDAARAAIAAEALESADFADRPGYDPNFLGAAVPLPAIKPAPRHGGLLRLPRPSRPDDIHELKYWRHSVLMSAGRRLAYVSACNIDYAAAATAGSKQGSSNWRPDPRLDDKQQASDRYYDGNDYDKGHLSRRDDVAWGPTLAQAIAANNDSFFFTNAAPQYFGFNQSGIQKKALLDELTLWGDLENAIAEQGLAQRTRLSVLNGPVFGDNDKPLRDLRIPLAFWKIVVWRDAASATPGALGFLLDQSAMIANLAEEAIDAGRFSIRQRPIAAIGALLDFDLSPLAAWDRMPAPELHESLDDDRIIRSRRDILGSA